MRTDSADNECAAKKHPCPDCQVCQFCSDRRCDLCQGWLVKKDNVSPTAAASTTTPKERI